jgi:hypothetical protein
MAEKPPTVPGIGAPGSGPEKDPNAEFAASRMGYMGSESVSTELIIHAVEPADLFHGLRMMELKLEDGNIPQSLGNDFRPPSILTQMFERAHNLHLSPEELKRRKWIVDYDPASGYAVLSRSKSRLTGLALDVDKTTRAEYKGELVTAIDLGTPETRPEMAVAYDRAVLEMETRAIVGEQIGVLLNLNVRDDLGTLVDWEHGTQAKYKPDHLKSLFNLPSIRELEEMTVHTPEEVEKKRELGDQIEEAMFLQLVMLKSGTKADMQDLLSRPGAQYLISKLAKEEEARRQNSAPDGTAISYTRDNWIADYIGDVDAWTDDMQRDLKTWRAERNDRTGRYATREFGRRGKLTKWGNICAFAGDPGEMSFKEEENFIVNDIGGAIDSVEASWIATCMMRNVGAYASEGYIALPNGTSHIPLGEFRFITSDDRGKFYSNMFDMKEATRGRSSGLQEMIGRTPDMAMNLFDWAQVVVDDVYERDEFGNLKNDDFGNAIKARRSIWDAWLGTAEQPKKDLVTGKVAEWEFGTLDINDQDDASLIANGGAQVYEGRSSTGDTYKYYVDKRDVARINSGDIVKSEVEDPVTHRKRVFFVTKQGLEAINNGNAIRMRVTDTKNGTSRAFYAKKVNAEGYHRLGDLNFDTLERDFNGTFGTMQWLMGRENGGVFTDTKNIDKFGVQDFYLSELKKKIKYIGIVLNPVVLTKGSMHLYDMGKVTYDGISSFDLSDTGGPTFTFHEIRTKGSETIQRNFFRNLIAARIHSANWVLNIMTKDLDTFNLGRIAGGLDKKIPVSNILELFIKEALREHPKTEEEVLRHYVDDLIRLEKHDDFMQPKKFYDETGAWLKDKRFKRVGIKKGRKARFSYERI